MIQPTFGQGLGFDESQSVLIDGKRVSVTLNMRPVFLTGEEKEGTAVIRFREVNTNNTIQHVTYHVKIMRASEPLLDERFHSHDGILAIRFEHADGAIEAFGERDSLYGAVFADQQNPSVVRGSILEGGLYHYNVGILSMEKYENRLSEPLSFDLYASIGKTTHYQVLDSMGNEEQLSIKTYYDQTNSLEYDSSSRKVIFSMPFNWNVNFLSQVPLVHEEVQIPRHFSELMTNGYIGTVNGVELSNREVLIDDYSYEEIRTVHFVVPKDRLIEIAQKQRPQEPIALFTLAPRDIPRFPLEILSGKEKFLLQISWSPAVMEPGKSTKFIVTVRDPKTLDTLNHATADFVLLKDGKELLRKQHSAPIGAIVQDYTFTEEQTGTVLLLIENINNTGDSAPLLFTVVPEFPLTTLAVMVMAISMFVILTRIGHFARFSRN
jgi:hypothetical protein